MVATQGGERAHRAGHDAVVSHRSLQKRYTLCVRNENKGCGERERKQDVPKKHKGE